MNMNPISMEAEMIGLLRDLIRIETYNPPGDEMEAAKYIAGVFAREGIESLLVESAPGRGSIIARIRGDGTKRPLLLMSHLDVVGVEADKWSHPPLSADIADGCIWGRGALDCKNTVALWMTAFLAVKRSRLTPKRDVIFLAAADEEAGGKYGMEWIVRNCYDQIDAEAALNEGGGFGIELLGRTYYTYQSAEKGNIWLRITAKGQGGHASVPHADNAVLKLHEGLNRLLNHSFPARMTRTAREMISTIASTQAFPLNLLFTFLKNPIIAEKLVSLLLRDRTEAAAVRSLLKNTVCPTVLRAGSKTNVIPSEAQAEVDIRILPGYDVEQTMREIRSVIGIDCEVEMLDVKPPTESPTRHPLAESIKKAVYRHRPESHVIPVMFPAVTDGSFLRVKGMVVYGFTPLLPSENVACIHGHDERISLDSVRFGLHVGLDVIWDFVFQCLPF